MIYYDTHTGNSEAFAQKVAEKSNEKIMKVDAATKITEKGHFITYTIGNGELSGVAKEFLKNNHDLIETVSSSGNDVKHPTTYGFAVDKANALYPEIKKGIRFNLKGDDEDLTKYLKLIA